MRRNTVTLVKYLVGSTLLITTGVLLLHAIQRTKIKSRANEDNSNSLKGDPNQAVPDETLRPVSI